MSWADGVLSVWSWSKQGIVETYDKHLRPACPQCTSTSSPGPQVSVSRAPLPGVSVSGDIMIRSGMTRIAGLSGAAAIALGAYGAHAMQGVSEEQRKAFEVANRYHLIHSVALLATSQVRLPRLTGMLMIGGVLTFCGTTYYHALTGDNQWRKLTPFGGIMLIAAWLSMIL